MFLFSVCVITIFRLKAVLAFRQADPTYTIWSTVMWSEMEPTLGIICTCAPMMRPIFDKLFAQYRAKRTVGPFPEGIVDSVRLVMLKTPMSIHIHSRR